MTTSSRIRVCFVGLASYAVPLDPTQEKKIRRLAERFDIFVVGRAPSWRPIYFYQHAYFYLLPRLWPAALRQALIVGGGSLVATWVVIRHRIDVIVAQSPYEGVAGAVAKRIARLFGRSARLVIETHSDFESDPFQQRKMRFARFYRKAMIGAARFSFSHADALRSVSTSTEAQIVRWAPDKPVVRFPAWTDMEVFLNAGPQPNSHADFLFVGVLIPRKGVHHLIRSLARVAANHRMASLTILGEEVNRQYANELRELIRDLEMDDRVRFEPALPQERLASRMAQAVALVLPSLSEGLGRVVFEAMATGTPVVASEVGGIPDMVLQGETGWLVPPGDEGALAERLDWVLTHPKEVAEAGRRAREFAAHFFSADQFIANYELLFARAMEQSPDRCDGTSVISRDTARKSTSKFSG